MIHMLLLTFRINKEIINEDNYKTIKEWLEHGIHKIHKHIRSISKTKRHHHKFKVPTSRAKTHLGNVRLSNLQLMTTRMEVNL